MELLQFFVNKIVVNVKKFDDPINVRFQLLEYPYGESITLTRSNFLEFSSVKFVISIKLSLFWKKKN